MRTLDYIDMYMKWRDDDTGKWYGYSIKKNIRAVPIGVSVIKRPEEVPGLIDYHVFVRMYFSNRIQRIKWVWRWDGILKKGISLI